MLEDGDRLTDVGFFLASSRHLRIPRPNSSELLPAIRSLSLPRHVAVAPTLTLAACAASSQSLPLGHHALGERKGGVVSELVLADVKPTPYERRRVLYTVHRGIVAPLIHALSSAPIRARVHEHLHDAQSVLVVAGGDDALALELAGRGKTVIINDIDAEPLHYLERQAARYEPPLSIQFVQADARLLADRVHRPVDAVFMKNALHHLQDQEDAQAVISTLMGLGRHVLLIEIEDPRKHWLAHAWNRYYRWVLGDDGENFLDFSAFRRIVTAVAPSAEFGSLFVLKGNYMFASIET